MADDDAHNLTKIKDGIHCFNLINTDLVKDSILHSIKTGRLVGVNFNVNSIRTNEEKKAALHKLPKISGITLISDTLSISLTEQVKAIRFIGQNGLEMKRIADTSSGSYLFRKEDTYIRAELLCNDSTIYYFNPVFRYNGKQAGDNIPEYDIFRTWLWRSVVIIVLLSLFLLIKRFRK
jgi:hypothetical protein